MFEQSHPQGHADAGRSLSDHPRASPCRPRVQVAAAASKTRRTTRACDNCRRLKEKCNGGTPCDRCTKSSRRCVFTNAFRRTRNPHNPGPPRSRPPPGCVDADGFFEVERIRALERIVRHFTGVEECTSASLERVVVELDRETPGRPGEAGAGCDEFSHADFSRRVQMEMESQPEPCQNHLDIVPAQQLLSRDSLVHSAASLFPPSEMATLMLDVFFNVSQTNYFYVDESLLRHRLSLFYTPPPSPLTISDAPWVCTALMVFAVGAQFAHLATSADQKSLSVDDALALAFFRKATGLVPDVLAIACPVSVQAFGLLGIYALPLDPAGLSCTYFGIAIKIATLNGMHKKAREKTREAEVRNRAWWTVYTLERRISILHGRPVSISRSEVDADLPIDVPELRPSERVNTFQNVMAQRGITEIMADARDAILDLKKADKKTVVAAGQNVLRVKRHLESWWDGLPDHIYCKDLTPGGPLFRSNIHLALTYHLVHIFIGRSFIFDSTKDSEPPREWVNVRDQLIQDAITSAISSISLCRILQDNFGLSKSSYTEFTSCCAAVLALAARRIFSPTDALKENCNRGLALLKAMSDGVFATSCERRGVEILNVALRKLDGGVRRDKGVGGGGTGYREFRNWVALQQVVPGEALPRGDDDVLLNAWSGGSAFGEGRLGGQEFVHSTLADLALLPGLEDWFEHSMG